MCATVPFTKLNRNLGVLVWQILPVGTSRKFAKMAMAVASKRNLWFCIVETALTAMLITKVLREHSSKIALLATMCITEFKIDRAHTWAVTKMTLVQDTITSGIGHLTCKC